MNIRRIKIWLSRGWFHVVCSVSLLLAPLFCGKRDVFAATYPARQETKDTVSVKAGDVVTGIVRKKDGTPFPGVRISQNRNNVIPGVTDDTIKAPVVITDENGLFSLTVTDASDMLYFMHNGCAVEDFLLDRHSYDVILFDNYKDYYDEYPCQTDTTYKDKPHRSNVPGVIVYMVAYGPPTINANVPEDTTLTRLTDEMIEKILKYEKKSNPRRSTAYGPAVDDGEEETVIELIPSKRELRRAARRAGK